MTVPTHSDKYDDLELTILRLAVDAGMTYEEACIEYDALAAGNTGTYTARMQAVAKKFWEDFRKQNS